MSWGWVMAIIAVVLVAMLVGFAVWLWRLLTDIYAEVSVLGRRAGQVADLLATIDLTPLEHADAPAGIRQGVGAESRVRRDVEADVEPSAHPRDGGIGWAATVGLADTDARKRKS